MEPPPFVPNLDVDDDEDFIDEDDFPAAGNQAQKPQGVMQIFMSAIQKRLKVELASNSATQNWLLNHLKQKS